MSNKYFVLNRTTITLGKIFPALLIFTPMMASAGTIDQSTSVPQEFNIDSEYIINKDVTISSSGASAAVSATGIAVTSIKNMGNISGTGNGLDIDTGAQRLVVENKSAATISSTNGNAVNVVSMQGDIINGGNITGFEKGILIGEASSSVNIKNTATGRIK